MLSASDVIARASNPDLLQCMDALLDMIVLPSTLLNSTFLGEPYLMLSLFSPQQKIVLWRFTISNTQGRAHFYLFASLHFDLKPREAKFIGDQRFYVGFFEPCLRIYNLGEIRTHYYKESRDLADDYEYELSFESSQLVIRSPYLDEKELAFNIQFPENKKAIWQLELLEKDMIICLESTVDVLVLLNISSTQQQASCKVFLLERDQKASPLSDFWISTHIEEKYRKIYFIDESLNIYQFKFDSTWIKDEEVLIKGPLKQVFDRSKFPEVQKFTIKRFEFFSWIQNIQSKLSSEKEEKCIDACIIFTSTIFYLVNLETEAVRKIILPERVIVTGWFVFNNVLSYAHNQAINQVSLFPDYYFGASLVGPSLIEMPINFKSEFHFLKCKGFIAVACVEGINAPSIHLIFLHFFHFRMESLFPQAKPKSVEKMLSLEFDLNGLPNASRNRDGIGIPPSQLMKFDSYQIKSEENSNSFPKLHIEVKDSLIFLRGYNAVNFVDISSKYKTFQKPTQDAKSLSTHSSIFKEEKPQKFKLVNYQKLIPNLNAAVETEQIIEKTKPTKTALKKELKGLSKSQRLQKFEELELQTEITKNEKTQKS